MLPMGLMYDFMNGDIDGEMIMREAVIEPLIQQREKELELLAEEILSTREQVVNEKIEQIAGILADINSTDPNAAVRPLLDILEKSITKGKDVCKKNSEALETARKSLLEKNRQQYARAAELNHLRNTVKSAPQESEFGKFLKEANDKVCTHIGRSHGTY